MMGLFLVNVYLRGTQEAPRRIGAGGRGTGLKTRHYMNLFAPTLGGCTWRIIDVVMEAWWI